MGSPDGDRLAVDLITGRLSDAENPFSYERFAQGIVTLAADRMAL
jgi:hypothetical protein